jgi:Concanavalin A-like lectin/glucanases superfamily
MITKFNVWHLNNPFYAIVLCVAMATAPSLVQAQDGAALNFDGVDDYVEFATDPVPYGAGSYTKEAWIRVPVPIPGVTPEFPNILSAGSNGFAQVRHFLYLSGANLTAGHNSEFTAVQNPNPISFNQWVHVAVTFDHTTNTMRLYQNGALVSTNTVGQIAGGNLPLLIGAFAPGESNQFFTGDVDEVRIWNVARTADQIKWFRKAELRGDETGLVAYYRFNQGTADANNAPTNPTLTSTGVGAAGTFSTNFTRNGPGSNFIGVGGVVTDSKYAIWNGTAWGPSTPPTAADVAVVSSVTPSQPGNLTTAQYYVAPGLTNTIASGESVTVNGDFDYSGATVEVLTGGSFVQTTSSTFINSTGTSRFRVIRTDATNGAGYNYISSPVAGVTIGSIGNNATVPISPFNYANFRYTHNPNNSPASARWVLASGGTQMAAAVGYTYVQPAGSNTLTFTNTNGVFGRPRNGDVTIGVGGVVGYRFNLVGNPYPSPLNMLTFFQNNAPGTGSNVIDALYFWVDNNNNTGRGTYTTKNAGNIISTDRIAVAQGFMVQATGTPLPLTFNNAQRISATTALLRTEADEIERFKLVVSRDGMNDELWLTFGRQFTDQIEAGYDATKFDGNQGLSLAARLNDARLAIAALPNPEAGRNFELPLTLTVNRGGAYTFGADEVNNPTAEKLFLEDRVSGEFYFLQVGKSHTLNLQAGNYRDRFFLRKANEVKGDSQLGESGNAYAFGSSLFVKASETAQVAVFSTMGVEVQRFSQVSAGDVRRLEVNVPSSGVYLVKVATASGTSESRVWLDK